ncbi:MAG: tetratricopeptide repeat protein [Thermomicrobiales bacterium]|nr:tetratricopeptide repeat protein [Thermomicrobiales bacterium]
MNRESTPPFGERLRHFRQAAGLTQEVLAERAGVSRDAVSALEGGRRRHPHPQTVRALATALGLSEREALALRAAAPKRTVVARSQAPETRASSLPVAPTRLVGRRRELAELRQVVAGGEVRLVTLTGPGGVGKTRLALELARVLEPLFADGITFVSLASVQDPMLVMPEIAEALGVQEGGGRSLAERAVQFCRDRQPLLVLDNFEHVIEAATDLASLLAACPTLTVLTTSREALRLSGEHEYPVAPLTAPLTGEERDLASLASNEAVALFAQRARAASPDFTLTPLNAAAVASICRRLDGLPLAIELAAARVKVLPAEALLARIEKRLPLLTGGPRDQPLRLRAMRDAIAWSYDLLDAEEQTLFRRLAIFTGGFTLEAADWVARWHEATREHAGARVVATLPFELVASLIDKSLLLRLDSGEGEPRFGMLATIREFGLERLSACTEAETTRTAHAAYYLALAERAEPELIGPDQGVWLARMETEHDNVRLALEWLRDHGGSEDYLRLSGALSGFWEIRGHLSEGQRWLAEALTGRDEVSASVTARALRGAGVIAREQGDYAAAAALGEDALALFRELGDTLGIALTARLLGDTASDVGDYARAAAMLEEGLALFRALGDASSTSNMLNDLGVVARRRREFDLAARLFEESLALARAAGYELGVARTLSNLGHVAADQHDDARAIALYLESLELQAEVGDLRGIAWSLERITALPLACEWPEQAAQLLGAADAARDAAGLPLPPAGRDWYDRTVDELQIRLGETAFQAAWTTGRALPLAQAIAAGLVFGDRLG